MLKYLKLFYTFIFVSIFVYLCTLWSSVRFGCWGRSRVIWSVWEFYSWGLWGWCSGSLSAHNRAGKTAERILNHAQAERREILERAERQDQQRGYQTAAWLTARSSLCDRNQSSQIRPRQPVWTPLEYTTVKAAYYHISDCMKETQVLDTTSVFGRDAKHKLLFVLWHIQVHLN